jgi:hypothetical protein
MLTQYPSLCTDYIELIRDLVEYCPTRLVTLPPALLQAIFQSLMFGVTQNHNLAEKSLISIQGASFSFKQGSQEVVVLDDVAMALFEHIVTKPFDVELIPVASLTLLAIWYASSSTFAQIISKGNHSTALELHTLVTAFDGNLDGDLNDYQLVFSRFVTEIKELTVL